MNQMERTCGAHLICVAKPIKYGRCGHTCEFRSNTCRKPCHPAHAGGLTGLHAAWGRGSPGRSPAARGHRPTGPFQPVRSSAAPRRGTLRCRSRCYIIHIIRHEVEQPKGENRDLSGLPSRREWEAPGGAPLRCCRGISREAGLRPGAYGSSCGCADPRPRPPGSSAAPAVVAAVAGAAAPARVASPPAPAAHGSGSTASAAARGPKFDAGRSRGWVPHRLIRTCSGVEPASARGFHSRRCRTVRLAWFVQSRDQGPAPEPDGPRMRRDPSARKRRGPSGRTPLRSPPISSRRSALKDQP